MIQVSGFLQYFTNLTDCHDITKILLKAVLDIHNANPTGKSQTLKMIDTNSNHGQGSPHFIVIQINLAKKQNIIEINLVFDLMYS